MGHPIPISQWTCAQRRPMLTLGATADMWQSPDAIPCLMITSVISCLKPDPMSSDFIWDALSTLSRLKGFIYYSFNLNQGLANFFCKGADSTYVSPIDRMVSVTTTQPCLCSSKAAIDNIETNGCGRVSFKLYLQSWMTSQIWPACYNFPTPWKQCSHPTLFLGPLYIYKAPGLKYYDQNVM